MRMEGLSPSTTDGSSTPRHIEYWGSRENPKLAVGRDGKK